MKKIILSLGVMVFAGAMVVSATGAFFNDTETSSGNTFAAGELDLTIDNTSYGFDYNDPNAEDPTGAWGPNQNNSWDLADLTNQLFFNFFDLKPGDYGEDTISLHVQNDAWACMAFDLAATPDNGINDPEADAGDVTDGQDGGELQKYLSFLFWWDDGDNVLENDETVITALSDLPEAAFTGAWLPIAQPDDAPLQAGETMYIGKGWCFGNITAVPVAQEQRDGPTADVTGFTCDGSGDNNDAQTDGIVVNVGFYAEQSRNNPQFSCANLPQFVGEGGRPVGANLEAYVAPSCNLTVEDNQTIQDAVDSANPDDTVCVPDGTYGETVHITTPGLTLASLTGPTNTATIDGGVIIDAPDVTVTGFKVLPGNTEGTTAGFYLKELADNAKITYNDIDGTSAGAGSRGVVNVISTDLPNVYVENNWIHDLTTGVYTNPHTGTPWYIRFNDIDDNVAGIGELNHAYVVANEFEGNTDEAIGAGPTYDVASTITNNNILGGDLVNKYGVWPAYDAGAPAIVAENNYWAPSGAAAQTNGNVDFLPETLVMYPHN